MRLLRRGTQSSSGSLIFFATDIHGSERCFRKFLNAGTFYGTDILIMGGDLTGKMLVPITPNGRGWNAEFGGRAYHFDGRDEVANFTTVVRDSGAYVLECEEDELAAYQDQDAIEQVIARVALESVRRWVELADERLADTGIQCFMSPGNDDMLGVEEAIAGSQTIVNPDGRLIQLADGRELIATGYSNITPWRTDRELEERELERLMVGLFDQIQDPASAIAVLHVPPAGSGLDMAPRLDDDLRIQTIGGEPEMVPVGSTAVRDVIERFQPLLALHGHIHESQGAIEIGRTMCVNPGSDYSDGVLRGALIRIEGDRVRAVQLVTG
jgi:Icc-related predicted phosphoesterase